ncbi:MAG: 16S rRNA (guanine(527)-N(7))-methyltransferase RsmG [Candidatus Limnocylindrales bacterium]
MDRLREPLPSRVEGLPELPTAALAVLDAGLATLGLADLAEPARTAVADHLRLLLAWNTAINLTAIRDPTGAARRHVLDSLTAIPILRDRGIDALLDLGSGGGFPGLPLAVVLPARRALLVESVAKKARFLEVAAAAVGPAGRIEAFAGRAEELATDRRHRERWPAVVARAVGDLSELAELGLPLLAPNGVLIAWKRHDVTPELVAAEQAIEILGGDPPAVVEVDPRLGLDGHVLVVVTKTGRTPAAYPRDPAERKRRSL